jgi:hypothetical protein
MTLVQTRDTVTGTISFGGFGGTVSGTMAANGQLTIAGTTTIDIYSIAITSWTTNSLAVGAMTGTFSQRATATGLTGNAMHTCELVSATRTATAQSALSSSGRDRPTGPARTIADALRSFGLR